MAKKYMTNKEELEFKIRDFMDHFTGLDTPLKEFVCDEDGKKSDDKIDEFIGEIFAYMRGNDWFYQYYGMSGAQKVCLEKFLYLAITSYNYVDRIETFRDILDLLVPNNMGYKSMVNLHEHEVDEMRTRPNAFFGRINDNYKELCGHNIIEDTKQQDKTILDKEEDVLKASDDARKKLQVIYDEYKDRGMDPIYDLLEDSLPPIEEMLDYPDELRYPSIDDPEYIGNLNDNNEEKFHLLESIYWSGSEAYKKRQKDKAEALAAWKESIQDPEKFLEACRDFRKLYFVVGVNKRELEETFIHFLHAKGKCKLDKDEKVSELYVALNRAKRVVDRS